MIKSHFSPTVTNSIRPVPLGCFLCLPSTIMFNSTTFHIFSSGEFHFIYFSLSFHIIFPISHCWLLVFLSNLSIFVPFQQFPFLSFSHCLFLIISLWYQFTTSASKQQPQQESKYKNPYHYYVLQRKKALRWKAEAHVQSII